MRNNLVLELINSLPEFDRIKEIISVGETGNSENIFVSDATKSWIFYSLLQKSNNPLVLVVEDPSKADNLFSEFEFIYNSDTSASFSLKIIDLYSSWTYPKHNELVWDITESFTRIRGLTQLLNYDQSDESQKVLVITTKDALIRKTVKREFLLDHTMYFSINSEFNVLVNIENLVSVGYKICDTVRIPGDISSRGGLIDIYPINSEHPVRLDFLGNKLENIRVFDPETQLSISTINEVVISPSSEYPSSLFNFEKAKQFISESEHYNLCNKHSRIIENFLPIRELLPIENLEPFAGFFDSGMLIDYLPKNNIFLFDEFNETQVDESKINYDVVSHSNDNDSKCKIDMPSPVMDWEEVYDKLLKKNLLINSDSYPIETVPDNSSIVNFSPTYLGQIDKFIEDIKAIKQRKESVIICSSFPDRIRDILISSDNEINLYPEGDSLPEIGEVVILQFPLREGFSVYSRLKTTHILTDKEIFGYSKKNVRKRTKSPKFSLSADLTPNSLIVHSDHGIGRFVGVEIIDSNIGTREYISIEYAAGDRLYVPMDQAGKLSSYVAPKGSKPSLSRLGTQEWKRTKERAAKAAKEIAQSLIKLYASRQILPGYQFSSDTVWQSEFEDAFMYTPTRDQKDAVDVIKYSMESPHPMNYLVCGDVGYGKTEIAMRVAFKAVQDGKQVALLCPTTLLAQQHFRTFMERFNLFPLKIEVLSRFSNDIEQKRIQEQLASGQIDILIGTHKLLQRDTVFKDLGLVIVDDEQRFGVMHKEWLKRYHENVDVLTLTATPIPRTLSMALTGALDMVTVHTPPEDRQAVETHVLEYSDDLIREVISKELTRKGQVFFLHNRISDIHSWANHIKKIIPESRVCVAHSRLDEKELERVMEQFISGEKNVLISTTIIEAGIDIPNANTIIINRPELLGLAQLYQLRGRVGRGDRNGYAYLLVQINKILSESAEKRLLAMKSYQELGSGFRIAMKDLEIRGAGNILGSEQSGHMHSIGFDLYTQLLQESIDELNDTDQPKDYHFVQIADIKVTISLDAHIPIDYIPELSERLMFYKRLSTLTDEEEILIIQNEMSDRFGELPQSIFNIFYVLRVKIMASRIGVKSIVSEYGSIVIRFKYSINSYGAILEDSLGHLGVIRRNSIRVNESIGWQQNLIDVLKTVLETHQRALNLLEISENENND
ncbi:MAG: transcription-repair coupling factor [Chloroflexi bacterium]|mgnify:CR=1 FL=1|nr:transcription-repair coupling factor [Chloroflexota bacterium]|tara:strand:+ start:6960 stop:10493 length:3534 start_codon:yes stop_codon:yes gene_type:complete